MHIANLRCRGGEFLQTIDYTNLLDFKLNVHMDLGTPNDVWIIVLKKQTNICRARVRSIRVYTLA